MTELPSISLMSIIVLCFLISISILSLFLTILIFKNIVQGKKRNTEPNSSLYITMVFTISVFIVSFILIIFSINSSLNKLEDIRNIHISNVEYYLENEPLVSEMTYVEIVQHISVHEVYKDNKVLNKYTRETVKKFAIENLSRDSILYKDVVLNER